MNRYWVTANDQITMYSDDQVFFSDSVDHFENAVLRLLNTSEAEFKSFVERVSERIANSPERDILENLELAWREDRSHGKEFLPDPSIPFWLLGPEVPREWRTTQVRDNSDFGIAISPQNRHGWLSNTTTGHPAEVEDVEYEEDYFEGRSSDVGYGSYLEQSAWRLEKADRQCNEITALRALVGLASENLRVLDIGSGYGFFRQACRTKGWASDGIEISVHAARICQELFSLETFVCKLEDLEVDTKSLYDVIVMWDFIEHVDNPFSAIKNAQALLSQDGSLFIRTPNLEAMEFQVFGHDYHSLKREHLNLFSPYSLAKLVKESGMIPQVVLTSSHLLKGFVGLDTSTLATCQLGSDILLFAQNVTN